MNDRRAITHKIIAILVIFQLIFIGRFVLAYFEDPFVDTVGDLPILELISLFLLARLYVLVQPRRARRPRVSPGSTGLRTSIHGLSLGDIVYVRHLEMNAKIEKINKDNTYEVRTLLNQSYTVDIRMIEISKPDNDAVDHD